MFMIVVMMVMSMMVIRDKIPYGGHDYNRTSQLDQDY